MLKIVDFEKTVLTLPKCEKRAKQQNHLRDILSLSLSFLLFALSLLSLFFCPAALKSLTNFAYITNFENVLYFAF